MRTPASTYRLQITPEFTFQRAAEQLERLQDLGADWIYLSPVLRSVGGSDHGYDVADPTEIDPARGGREGFDALCRAAHERGMGVLVDVVPNHQGVAVPAENPWWWSVLAQGQDSPHASAFDIDWEAAGGKLLIPVLGDDDGAPGQAEQALDALELRVGEHGPVLAYYDNEHPLAEGTYRTDGSGAPTGDARDVHERQHYRLVNWRTGDAELNYRRFFTVTTLAGVRVEDPEVFAASHVEIRRWFQEGLVDGLRVDHPDGVRDPGGYLRDLQELTGGAYVLIEKILEPGERLPRQWLEEGLTAGTTGYDALGQLDRVLVDPAGAYPLTTLDSQLRSSSSAPGTQVGQWAPMIRGTKRDVAQGALAAEVARLVREARQLPELDGFPDAPLSDALSEILSAFPVYRTYLPEGAEHLRQAVEDARRRRGDLLEVLDALETALGARAEDDAELTGLARRFQQTSGMVMAKGVEDSAFYRFSRLTSLTEVGGDPSLFAIPVAELHQELARRQELEPLAMTALSTHDTKRSETVRARIHVLSELASAWASTVSSVSRALTARGITHLTDRTLLNLVLQAVVGAWPISRDRAVDYALKAAREAQTATAWVDGDDAFEQDLVRAVELMLTDPTVRGHVEGMVRRVEGPGWSNALALKLLQLTMPGVPDVYQGSETWETSLVDPDNRRPVDHAGLTERLARLDARRDDPAVPRKHSVPAVDQTGDAKLLVTSRALRLRRDRPELFTHVRGLQAQGPAAEHVIAVDRGGAIAVATRLPAGLQRDGGWRGTALELPEGTWIDELTGGRFTGRAELSALLDLLPVALLRRA